MTDKRSEPNLRTSKKSLEGYISYITEKGSKNVPIPGGDYDPRNLRLNRQNYGFNEGALAVGTEENVPEAREQRKKILEEKFEGLVQDPQNILKLADYAEEIWWDGYPEIAQEALGRVLSLYPRDPNAYHLLSRINLSIGAKCKKKKELASTYLQLAEQLAERGLELVDDFAGNLVPDKLDALSSQKKPWNGFDSKLTLGFSERCSRIKKK